MLFIKGIFNFNYNTYFKIQNNTQYVVIVIINHAFIFLSLFKNQNKDNNLMP